MSRSSMCLGHGDLEHTCASRNGEHTLQYNTYVILKRAGLTNVVALPYGATLCQDSEFFEINEGEIPSDVSDESIQDWTIISCESDLGMLHRVLSM